MPVGYRIQEVFSTFLSCICESRKLWKSVNKATACKFCYFSLESSMVNLEIHLSFWLYVYVCGKNIHKFRHSL